MIIHQLIALSIFLLVQIPAIAAETNTLTFSIDPNGSTLQTLHELDFDIAGVDLDAKLVDVISHNQEERERILSLGFNLIEQKNHPILLAPAEEYLTYDEIVMKLERLAAYYTDIMQMKPFGQSVEGRILWAIKISDNVASKENEPAVLFNGMHHAREIMTSEVMVDMIDYLLASYGNDQEVTRWIDQNEIWIVPMVNPDGNHKVWTGNSMWRKNVQGGYGVDLNRNYPLSWNTCNGSSSNKYANDYRGPSAGSEPETQSMMKLIGEIQPVFNISYHSFSEMVLYPHGCDGLKTPNTEVIENVGEEIARKLPKDHSNGYYDAGTPWELLYGADGSDIDWMYLKHQVIPYVIEINSRREGFQPPYRWRDRTVIAQRGGWSYLLDRLERSGIRGQVISVDPVSNKSIQVESIADNQLVQYRHRIKDDGSYHIVLNPGMYRITFDNNISHDIIIGEERLHLDIEL